MPLIKDNPWLISQLLQSVADEESKRELLKKGQVTPENKASAEGLKAMLVNLRNQITPSKPDPNRVGQVDSALSLSSNHMDSMGDMVTWLATNKVTMGDQVIVYPGNIARPSEEYGYFKIEPGTEIIIPLAKQDRNVVAYWINPTALKGYLMSLQADPKLRGNVIFQVQLLKLIQDANKQLDVDVSEEYKEPVQELPDNTEVDRFPKTIENLERFSQPGTEPLLYGNIKSLEALNSWLGQKGIGMKVENQVYTMKDQEFDTCAIINYMYGRANLLYQRRTKESAPVMLAYVKSVTEVAKQSNCNLTAPGQKSNQQQQQSGQGGLAAASPQILTQLSSLRPFNANYISFTEISTFVDLYAKFANDDDTRRTAADLTKYISTFKLYLGQASPTIPLTNITSSRFKSMLKAANEATNASNLLYDIVFYAGQMYQTLIVSLQSLAQDAERGKYIDYRSMQQQVVPGGPWQTNLTTLDSLRKAIQREWMAQK
jgi:hypothetical protein